MRLHMRYGVENHRRVAGELQSLASGRSEQSDTVAARRCLFNKTRSSDPGTSQVSLSVY